MAGERHTHCFVPTGGLEQRGTERMEQFCVCGARRCVGDRAGGFGSSSMRCSLAAMPGERYCKRHKERRRGADWVPETAEPKRLDAAAARQQLTNLMRKHDDYGAQDTEGWDALRIVERAAQEGQRFPFASGGNHFQLYQSVPGWEAASAELNAAAEVYWKAVLSERLGVTII
jgi:hypothetical protein